MYYQLFRSYSKLVVNLSERYLYGNLDIYNSKKRNK